MRRRGECARAWNERRPVSLAAPFCARLFVAGAVFFAPVPAIRARGPRHHPRRVCRRERHHAGRARGAVYLWRHGRERLRFVRDRRGCAAAAVAQPPCGGRSGAQLHRQLKRNLFEIVALCRVVPGVVFVAFVACGWRRVPLARFTVASLVVSALYLPLMLCIVVFFGDTLDGRVGWWAWPLLLCVLVAIGFVRRQVFSTSSKSPSPPTTHGRSTSRCARPARSQRGIASRSACSTCP